MAQIFAFGQWRAWAEDQKPYNVHLSGEDSEITFSANEIDRLIELLARVGNTFYLETAQVRVIDGDEGA